MEKITISAVSLENQFSTDVSKAVEYVRSLLPEYPTRPNKPRLSTNHSSADAKEYAKNLVDYEVLMETYKTERDKLKDINYEYNQILELYIKNITGFFSIPEKSQPKVWRKAWEDGHANGHYEVYLQLDELVDLFD